MTRTFKPVDGLNPILPHPQPLLLVPEPELDRPFEADVVSGLNPRVAQSSLWRVILQGMTAKTWKRDRERLLSLAEVL